MFNLRNNQSGYSLIEMLVAVSLFSAIMLAASAVFQSAMESQRSTIASQNIQENMKFILEVMSKEIRSASGDHAGSVCASGGQASAYYKVFNNENNDANIGTELYFKNRNGNCVIYKLNGSQIEITREALSPPPTDTQLISPDDIEISDLQFFIKDDEADALHTQQPRVTISMKAKMKSIKTMYQLSTPIQTTISSRYYE